ncbi:PREDICTED: uncharacterized protein LOC104542167 [Mesitornis unicolor]|uniref:uncharacterized protein LOC104542167 n=1 Tax=Mesitornis unicolor TaxID=54374 RepID=UPI000528A251|nr:PREDICTED: uncharacterized protein LOC104542167 [Mesitornis unicolor]
MAVCRGAGSTADLGAAAHAKAEDLMRMQLRVVDTALQVPGFTSSVGEDPSAASLLRGAPAFPGDSWSISQSVGDIKSARPPFSSFQRLMWAECYTAALSTEVHTIFIELKCPVPCSSQSDHIDLPESKRHQSQRYQLGIFDRQGVFINKQVKEAATHTTVLPFVLIEMRTTHHQYPSRSCGLAAVCTFAIGYILWVCWIHHVTGVWVYPLLEHLSPGVKIIFFAAVTVVINIFYLLGEVLNNYIWDTQRCIEEGKEKPKLD